MTAPTGDPVRVHLVVLAGGQGLRAGGGPEATPKQFRATGRGPLFAVSLRSLLDLDPARVITPRGLPHREYRQPQLDAEPGPPAS